MRARDLLAEPPVWGVGKILPARDVVVEEHLPHQPSKRQIFDHPAIRTADPGSLGSRDRRGP
jgi:hypothetical protein